MTAPTLTRDEAFARIDRLLLYLAGKFGRSRHVKEEVYQQSAAEFLARYDETFDGHPGHLATFAKWMHLNAVRRVRNGGTRFAAEARTVRLSEDYDAALPEPDAGLDPEVRAAVRSAVADLPARYQEVVSRTFGLDGGEPEECLAVAGDWGCTRANVSDIRMKAFEQIRGRLGVARRRKR